MKYLSIIFFIISIQSNCQNLISNSSFEDFSQCPKDNTFYAINWNRPVNHYGTADYLNTCAPFSNTDNSSYVSVPINWLGNQTPRNGNAYIGLACYYPTTVTREYIQTQLTSPLIANEYYEVSFFISLADSSTHAVNNIGAAITNNPIVGNNDLDAINVIPQINSSAIISDKINWFQIKGVFQAAGGEDFLTLGNFYPKSNTSVSVLNNSPDYLCYYFIDDVLVVKVEKPVGESNCLTFTNPVYEILHIENTNQNLIIVDMSGKKINRNIINNEIYVGDLQDGMYIVYYTCNGKNQYKKFVKL